MEEKTTTTDRQSEKSIVVSGTVIISEYSENYEVLSKIEYEGDTLRTIRLKLPKSNPNNTDSVCITINGVSLKYKEIYKKWPRNTDNAVNLFTFIFNAIVAVIKIFVAGTAIGLLILLSSIFSFCAGITGSVRSIYGLWKAIENRRVLVENTVRSNKIRNIENTEITKHALRLLLDICLIIVGVLGMVLTVLGVTALSVYTMIASVVLIAGFSLVSWFAMKRKRKIARDISCSASASLRPSQNEQEKKQSELEKELTQVYNGIDDSIKHYDDVLKLIKENDQGYKKKRERKFNKYSGESAARIALAIITILLTFLTLSQTYTIFLLVIPSLIAATITIYVKVWFAYKSKKNGDKRTATVTTLPENIREKSKGILDIKMSSAMGNNGDAKHGDNQGNRSKDTDREQNIKSVSVPLLVGLLESLLEVKKTQTENELIHVSSDNGGKVDRATIPQVIDEIALTHLLEFIQQEGIPITLKIPKKAVACKKNKDSSQLHSHSVNPDLMADKTLKGLRKCSLFIGKPSSSSNNVHHHQNSESVAVAHQFATNIIL